MLSGFRKLSSGIASKLLLGFLVLTFVIWGIGDIFRNGGSDTTIATMKGEKITESQLDNLIRKLQRAYPQITAEVVADPQFRMEALRSMIDNSLLEKESTASGLSFSRDTLANYIGRDTKFKKEGGGFNRELFHATLRQNGWSEGEYLTRLQNELSTALLRDTVSAGIEPSTEMLSVYYAIAEEKREANLILVSKSDIGALPEATPEELKKLYDSAQRAFTAPEFRTMRTVAFDGERIWKLLKLDPSDETLKAQYDQHVGDYLQPEKRAVSQLLFTDEAAAKAVHGKLKGGMKWDDAAKDPTLLNKDFVELGDVAQTELPATAAKPVFALEKNDFSEPLQSNFGWHIFRVTAIKPAHQQSFDEARKQLLERYRGDHMEEHITQLSNTLEDALAGGAKLEDALKQVGLDELAIVPLGPISADGQTPDGTVIALSEDELDMVKRGFSLDEGVTSSLSLTQKGKYYLVQVNAITASKVKPIEAVTDELKKMHREQATHEAIRKKADEIAEILKKADNAQEAAKKAGLPLIASGPLKRMNDTVSNSSQLKDKILTSGFVQEIFQLHPAQSTGAYPLPSGEYIIGILDAIKPASTPKPEDLEPLKKELGEQLTNDVLEQYMVYLRKKYDVNIKAQALKRAAS